MKYFVLTTRGLEEFAKQEIQNKLQGSSIENNSYRKVIFSYDGNVEEILKLRSVEDGFLFIGELENVDHTQESLTELVHNILELNFNKAIETISDLRKEKILEFSISSSSVGKRNFSYKEIKDALSKALENEINLKYEDKKHEMFDIRIFLEHDRALVGIRLGEKPLHRRPYKLETTKATLQADIAYSMSMIAQINSQDVVLDPMCGSGTILIESSTFSPKIILGGDINTEAVRITSQNVKAFNEQSHTEIKVWDAINLPVEEKSVDKIICNLPFGKQIEINTSVEEFYDKLVKEFKRVIKDNGTMVLLTSNRDELLGELKKYNLKLKDQHEIAVNGEIAYILVIKPN